TSSASMLSRHTTRATWIMVPDMDRFLGWPSVRPGNQPCRRHVEMEIVEELVFARIQPADDDEAGCAGAQHLLLAEHDALELHGAVADVVKFELEARIGR